MAGIAYVKKRLYNPELIIDSDGVLPNSLKQTIRGYNIPTYSIKWTGTPQAGEELGTAASSVKDGTTTPFQITVVSSSVNDTDAAAGHARKVALIGVSVPSIQAYNQWLADSVQYYDSRPKSTVEVVAMDGTTDVLSSRYYLWVDHAYVVQWGSGGTDAAGNITIESPANTTLITITATYNESNGGVWHFPPNKKVKTRKVKMSMNAVAAAQDGLNLTGAFTYFDSSTNGDPDLDVDHYTIESPGGNCKEWGEQDLYRWTTTKSKCLWTETLIANAIASDIEIEQIVV